MNRASLRVRPVTTKPEGAFGEIVINLPIGSERNLSFKAPTAGKAVLLLRQTT